MFDSEDISKLSKENLQKVLVPIFFDLQKVYNCILTVFHIWSFYEFLSSNVESIITHTSSGLDKLYLKECGNLYNDPNNAKMPSLDKTFKNNLDKKVYVESFTKQYKITHSKLPHVDQ